MIDNSWQVNESPKHPPSTFWSDVKKVVGRFGCAGEEICQKKGLKKQTKTNKKRSKIHIKISKTQ